MVCYIGAHNLAWEDICEFGLEDTILVPLWLASLVPGMFAPDSESAEYVLNTADKYLSVSRSEFINCLDESKAAFIEFLSLFSLSTGDSAGIFDGLTEAFNAKYGGA